MRSAPALSSCRPDSVSDQRTLRPTRSEVSQPSAAVLASACRAAFSSTPSWSSAPTMVCVQTAPGRDSTNSPSSVSSSDLALVRVPAAASRLADSTPRR